MKRTCTLRNTSANFVVKISRAGVLRIARVMRTCCSGWLTIIRHTSVHISESHFKAKSPLVQQLRGLIRSLRMSPSTEDAYVGWAVKFIFHFGVKNPREMGGKEVTEYLSWLATTKKVSAATQNQAFNALLFLYNRALEMPLENIKAERAWREPKLPVWLTKDECVRLFDAMTGENRLAAMLAYGTGLRLMELLRLRVKDLDFGNGVLSVYQGKGNKNRIVPLPKSLVPALRAQVLKVKAIHAADLADGFGAVWMPDNLALKWPKAPKELGWQYLFPAKARSKCPARGEARHHMFNTGFQQSLARAGKAAGIEKHVHAEALRSSFVAHALELGNTIIDIQNRIGHKDKRTTLRHTFGVFRDPQNPLDILVKYAHIAL